MSVEENKAVVLRYFLETHNPPYTLVVIDETCTPAYAKRRWSWLRIERTAFPDASYTIDDVIAEGDKVVLRVGFTGTHSGPFWTPVGTLSPTGKRCTNPATGVYNGDYWQKRYPSPGRSWTPGARRERERRGQSRRPRSDR